MLDGGGGDGDGFQVAVTLGAARIAVSHLIAGSSLGNHGTGKSQPTRECCRPRHAVPVFHPSFLPCPFFFTSSRESHDLSSCFFQWIEVEGPVSFSPACPVCRKRALFVDEGLYPGALRYAQLHCRLQFCRCHCHCVLLLLFADWRNFLWLRASED